MAICKKRAFEVLEKISFERIAGTEQELKCANIIKEECEKLGIEAIIEDFEIEMPEVYEASLEVTAPTQYKVHCIGVGKSGNTDENGVSGPLCYIENALDANLLDVKGKIVLITGMVKPDQMKKIYDAGAIGYILVGGSLYDPEEMIPEIRTRNQNKKKGEDYNFPGVVIHITDAQKLLRAKPECLKIVLKQDGDKKGTSHNVIATIKGSEKPEEIVAFTAHFDSVIYSSGAWDNGTGSITIMELMHYFKANPPKRTVQFIWCGSEEIGLKGSAAFVEKRKEEMNKYLFCINVDMTGVLLGYDIAVCSCDESVAKYIDFVAKVQGYPISTKVDMYSSDSSSFAVAGVPAITFARINPRGGAEIHSRRDQLEYLDPDAFIKTVEFMAQFSDTVVNSLVFPVPRELPKPLLERIDQMKKMFGIEDKKPEVKAEEKSKEAEEKKDK